MFEAKLGNRRKGIVAEHIISSIFVFVGSFSIMFFGPLFLGAKGHSRHARESTSEIVEFMVIHPEVTITICTIITIIYNFRIYKRTSTKNHVFAITFERSKKELSLKLISLRSNEFIVRDINLENFDLTQKKNDSLFRIASKSIFQLRDKGKVVGIIDPENAIWVRYKKEIPQILSNLKWLDNENEPDRW